MTPQPKEILEHYKTKRQYEILALGCLQVKEPSLDMCDYVIYQALSDKKIWVRPAADFIEQVSTEEGDLPRFRKIV